MPRDEAPIFRPAAPDPAPARVQMPPGVLRDLLALLLVVTGVVTLDVLGWLWHWQAGLAGVAVGAVAVGIVLGID